jgi:hypothetical protein
MDEQAPASAQSQGRCASSGSSSSGSSTDAPTPTTSFPSFPRGPHRAGAGGAAAMSAAEYTPSRKLKHLLRARTATCDALGCNAQAVYCDQDHTIPGPTAPPISATSAGSAEGTIAASRHLGGSWNSRNRAFSAGLSRTAAPTPARPPSTTSDIPTVYDLWHSKPSGKASGPGRDRSDAGSGLAVSHGENPVANPGRRGR